MEAFRQQAVTLQLREAKAETSSKDHAAITLLPVDPPGMCSTVTTGSERS